MKFFRSKKKDNYSPEETPLGPSTFPRVGDKPSKFNFLGVLDQKKWWYITGGLALVVIAVLVIIFAQRASQTAVTEGVQIEINGPTKVTLGSDVSYELKIANNSDKILTENHLLVVYPDGYSFTNADPLADNSQGTEFSFDTLASGAEQTIRLNGRLTGGVKTEQLLIAHYQFKPQGSKETLQIDKNFKTTIETASFSFNADLPASLLPGNTLKIKLNLENNEQRPLEKLRVRAIYPGGFSFSKSTPGADKDDNIWDLDQLGIGEKQNFDIEGTLGGNVDEVKRFVFEVGFKDDNGEFLKQTELEKVVKLVKPTITINQSVNGKQEILADADTPLIYTVSFTNTGPAGLANLVMEVSFDDGVWDLSTLRAQNGGSIKDHLIKWDGVGVPGLRSLESGQKARVVFSVNPYRKVPINGSADKHFMTTTKPTIKIGSAFVAGNSVAVKYRALIEAGASASVASGASPPQVGQETVYDITWSVDNAYNDLGGARLVGEIPAGANFVKNSGHVSVGEDLTYNESKRQIVWNIGRVPANVGKLQPSFKATFRVKVTPAVNESGSKKLLVTNQSFSAKDDWTTEARDEKIIDVFTAEIP